MLFSAPTRVWLERLSQLAAGALSSLTVVEPVWLRYEKEKPYCLIAEQSELHLTTRVVESKPDDAPCYDTLNSVVNSQGIGLAITFSVEPLLVLATF